MWHISLSMNQLIWFCLSRFVSSQVKHHKLANLKISQSQKFNEPILSNSR